MTKRKFIRLPLLDFVTQEIANEKLIDFSKVAVISVQHLLETTGSMFEYLIELGLPAENFFLTGKLYSNDPITVRKLTELGIFVLPSSDGKTLGEYYNLLEHDCLNLWLTLLDWVKKNEVERVIVLDDGGVLINTCPQNLKEFVQVVGIEQTTSGVKLNDNPIMPVINVAQSVTKMNVEPAFISQAIIHKTRMSLLELNPDSIGIIGFGTIGRSLYHDLKNNYQVFVHDLKSRSLSLNSNEFRKAYLSLKDLYEKSDVIIGATGTDVSYLPILDNLSCKKLLLSVSSGDVEFRSLLKSIQDRTKSKYKSILRDVSYYDDNKELKILRGGTPVNFDNNIHSVLPEYIQLTRGLLLQAVIQASNIDQGIQPDFIVLDIHRQHKLLTHFSDCLGVNLGDFDFPIPFEQILQNLLSREINLS